MLQIGEFSKLSKFTVKALRFYEKEGLIKPAFVDPQTGYRYYEAYQLQRAARIKSYRNLGISVAQVKSILDGADARVILKEHANELRRKQDEIAAALCAIESLLKGDQLYEVKGKTVRNRSSRFCSNMHFKSRISNAFGRNEADPPPGCRWHVASA